MSAAGPTSFDGWKWSVHVGAKLGQRLCEVEHVGMVVSGCATAAMREDRETEDSARFFADDPWGNRLEFVAARTPKR